LLFVLRSSFETRLPLATGNGHGRRNGRRRGRPAGVREGRGGESVGSVGRSEASEYRQRTREVTPFAGVMGGARVGESVGAGVRVQAEAAHPGGGKAHRH